MIINKKTAISGVVLIVAIGFFAVYFSNRNKSGDEISNMTSPSPEPSAVESPSATPLPIKSPSATPFVGAVPSCALKGEIKFLNSNTYDNQDALFTYSGIDDPARNIIWTVSPQDDIQVGPNIFTRIPIPNGESLLGVFLPENPKYKKCELTAKVQYGGLVDGISKIFEKQCDGKTTIVLP